MINKFLSGLSENGKKLLFAAAILIVLALFDRLLIGPTMSRMSTIDGEIVKEQGVIKQDLHFLNYKDKILKEAQALDAYVPKTLPAEEEIIAGFLKSLDILAGKAGVALGKVTPIAGVQDKDFIKYQADLECTGNLADIITFMHAINSSKELMKVVKFSLASKKADTDEIKALMTVDKAVIGSRPAAAGSPAAADAAKTP